jgi:hypothetical protein
MLCIRMVECKYSVCSGAGVQGCCVQGRRWVTSLCAGAQLRKDPVCKDAVCRDTGVQGRSCRFAGMQGHLRMGAGVQYALCTGVEMQ